MSIPTSLRNLYHPLKLCRKVSLSASALDQDIFHGDGRHVGQVNGSIQAPQACTGMTMTSAANITPVLFWLRQVLHAARLIAPAVNTVAHPDIAKSGTATDSNSANSGGANSADGWRWCAAALAAAGLRRLAGQLRMAEVAVRMHALEFEFAERTLQVRFAAVMDYR